MWAGGWLAVAAVATAAGCGQYKYAQNRVTVLDAETGNPIVGAEVRLRYSAAPFSVIAMPRADSDTTDENGVAVLRATIDQNRGVWPDWDTSAEGYFPGYDNREILQASEQLAAALDSDAVDPVIELTLRRWVRPEPTVLVTVPTGYRGYVRVCPAESVESAPLAAHRRVFSCTIDAYGLCELPPAPILAEVYPPKTCEFRFADGTDLPVAQRGPREGDALAAWPLWWVDRCEVFVIADETTAAAERKSLRPQGVVDSSAYPAWAERVRRGPFSAP